MADSLALLADAGHNATDVLSLLLAWGASLLATRSPNPRRTYGFRRATILAALANSLLIMSAVGVIVWEDPRDGAWAIYAQRFDPSGVLGSNVRVNDDVGTADQMSPAVAIDGLGRYIVVWVDGRNGGQEIYAQRFDRTGSALGSNFCVHEPYEIALVNAFSFTRSIHSGVSGMSILID